MLEHLPNALTALRIAAVPVLAWLAIVRDGDVFVAVLIACLIGDVVDGRLARAHNATSSLGAQLDSIADTLLFLAAAGGIAVFYAEVISKHAVVFTLVPSAWIGENLVALWRYGRLSSFHTYLSRAAAVAMGLFVGALFVVGEQPAFTVRSCRNWCWWPPQFAAPFLTRTSTSRVRAPRRRCRRCGSTANTAPAGRRGLPFRRTARLRTNGAAAAHQPRWRDRPPPLGEFVVPQGPRRDPAVVSQEVIGCGYGAGDGVLGIDPGEHERLSAAGCFRVCRVPQYPAPSATRSLTTDASPRCAGPCSGLGSMAHPTPIQIHRTIDTRVTKRNIDGLPQGAPRGPFPATDLSPAGLSGWAFPTDHRRAHRPAVAQGGLIGPARRGHGRRPRAKPRNPKGSTGGRCAGGARSCPAPDVCKPLRRTFGTPSFLTSTQHTAGTPPMSLPQCLRGIHGAATVIVIVATAGVVPSAPVTVASNVAVPVPHAGS